MRVNTLVLHFAIGSMVMLILSRIIATTFGNSALDIALHDSYFVIAHSHILALCSLLFFVFALVYFAYPKVLGRELNRTLGLLHFWITFAGISMLLIPVHALAMTGVPRRYYSYEDFDRFNHFQRMNEIVSLIAILVFLAQFLFLINLVYSASNRQAKPKGQDANS